MHTNYTFPGILQWYEVIRTEQLTLSPVCTANEAVKSACKELQKEIDKTKKDSSIDAIKSLSMKLQGMISASVQGGIPKYQEAFFSPDYERLHPEERDRIRELKELLNEQVKLLDHGLHLMKTMDACMGRDCQICCVPLVKYYGISRKVWECSPLQYADPPLISLCPQ